MEGIEEGRLSHDSRVYLVPSVRKIEGEMESYRCDATIYIGGSVGLCLLPAYTHYGSFSGARETLDIKIDAVLKSLMTES
jgi:hypothetical protein